MNRVQMVAILALVAIMATVGILGAGAPVRAQEATPAAECIETTPVENRALVQAYFAETYNAGGQFIVGWSQYLEPSGDFRPYPVQAHTDPSDWLIKNPIPQQSAFWSAKLWKQLGAFREDLHYSFDYEYWLRIKFKAGVDPHVVHKCMAIFRLHYASKTMSGDQPFDPEDRRLRDEYMHYLTSSERRWVRTAIRHARARSNRAAGWAALKKKDLAAARKLALSTVTNALTSLDSWRLMFCALRGH